jgi:hypothetical protein
MRGADENQVVQGVALSRAENEYEERLCRAFSSGRSVVEIARQVRSRRALPIYRMLQRRGLIETKLKRTRYRGPAQMEHCLKRVRLSFAQWCNSWRFDPKLAEEELSQPPAGTPSEVRLAAARDFPSVYAKGERPLDLEEWEREISAAVSGYSFRIEWMPAIERYSGTIIGIDSLRIIGKYPTVIMMELIRFTWLQRAIDILKGPDKG